MQLLYAPRSPFSRKILATIAELDLEACIALVQVDPWQVDPWQVDTWQVDTWQDEARQDEARQDEARQDEARQDEARQDEARQDEARQDAAPRGAAWTNASLRRHNPACKVPTLLLDDGTALFDSPVIARYLDERAGNRLLPTGPLRWDALRREALGDALADAVIRRFVERLGPAGERIDRVVARQEAAIAGILDRLEGEPLWMEAPVDPGHLAIACALDYLDGRSPELAWRCGRDRVAAWFRAIRNRPSMIVAAAPETGAFRAAEVHPPRAEPLRANL